MTVQNKIKVQTLQYLEDERQDLKILDQFQAVRNVFMKFNTALPSSGPVERLFSYAGIVLAPKRQKLGDDMFEKLLLLGANK
jgi:hypothetical protein